MLFEKPFLAQKLTSSRCHLLWCNGLVGGFRFPEVITVAIHLNWLNDLIRLVVTGGAIALPESIVMQKEACCGQGSSTQHLTLNKDHLHKVLTSGAALRPAEGNQYSPINERPLFHKVDSKKYTHATSTQTSATAVWRGRS